MTRCSWSRRDGDRVRRRGCSCPWPRARRPSAKCSSSQVDIGGTCTSKKEVSKQIVSLTQGRHGEGGRQGRRPARRLRRRHGRQQGSRDLAVRFAGDAGHEVAPGLDGDPDAHDLRAAAAGAGQAQPRRHALEVVPRVPQRRHGDVADALERHLGLPRLHPGEPALPGGAARGAVPPVDRRRAAAVRVRAAGRLRPGHVLPLRAHQLHPARPRGREGHREVGDRADRRRSSSIRSGSPRRRSRRTRPSRHRRCTPTPRSAASTRSRPDGARRGASATGSS